MRKVEYLVDELVNILRGEVVGEISLLYQTSSLLCLGYAISNEDIRSISLDQLLSSDVTERVLQDAYEELERNVPSLHDVFEEIKRTTLNTETIKKIIALIVGSKLQKSEYVSANEYLLKIGSERLAKVVGILDAPSTIRRLLVNLFDQFEGKVYDPTSGLGGNLLEYVKKAQEPNSIEVYAQEMHHELCKLSKMRMYLNDIKNCMIQCENALVNPYLDNSASNTLKFDAVLMIPPFSMMWKEYEEQIRSDKYSMYLYGIPSVSNADWLYMSLAVNSLNDNGKAVVVTTLGTLFRGGAEEKIRKSIINFDYVESIIQLPEGLFTSTSIPVAIVIFNKNKAVEMKDKIQFINASSMYESAKRGRNTLSDLDINKIIDLYHTKQEVAEISILVSTNEMEEANLVPSKYVQSLVFESSSLGKVRIHEDRIKYTNKLGDIGSFYRGINVTNKHIQTKDGNYKIINYSDVKDGALDINSVQTYDIQNNARVEAYRVQEGDLIISNKGTTKVCVIPKHEGDMLISQNFVGVRLNKEFSAQYIKEYLESPLGEFLLQRKKTGTSIKMISMKDLQETPLVINDKSYQDKIMEEYVKREKELKEELLSIQEKLSSLKTELYDKMEINNIVEIV